MPAFNHINSYLRFCIHGVQDHRISGKVLSQRLTHPLEFNDLGNLLLVLEDIFDYQGFPKAFQSTRTFMDSSSDLSMAAEDPSQGISPAVIRASRGKVATFDVLVVSRRSSSWQGSVDWLDGGERQEFVSLLELVHMIDERLSNDSI